MKKLIFIGLIMSFSAGANTDYGFLTKLPGGTQLFNISPSKTLITDYKPMGELKVNAVDLREEYKWKIPSTGDKQSVVVERAGNHKKVKRITRTGKIPGRDGGENSVVTSLITPSGNVQSYTYCNEKFKKVLLGTIKKTTEDYKCTTWNKKSCDYVKNVLETGDLDKKITECNGLLKSISEHQKKLKELVQDDFARDIQAVNDINGFKGYKNSFELSSDSLSNVSSIYASYESGADFCEMLSNNPNATFEEPTNRSSTTDSDLDKSSKQ